MSAENKTTSQIIIEEESYPGLHLDEIEKDKEKREENFPPGIVFIFPGSPSVVEKTVPQPLRKAS